MEKVKNLAKRVWSDQGNLKTAKLITLGLSCIIFIVSLISILLPVLLKRWFFLFACILYAIFEAGVVFGVYRGSANQRKWILYATILVFVVSVIGFNLALLDFPITWSMLKPESTNRESLVLYTLIFEILLGFFLLLQLSRIVSLLIYNRWAHLSTSELPKKDQQLEITIPTNQP